MSTYIEELKLELKEDLKLFRNIQTALRSRKLVHERASVKIPFYEDMLNILMVAYDNSDISDDPAFTKQWVAKEGVKLISELEGVMKNSQSTDKEVTDAYEIWRKTMALVSRESFHHFLLYEEIDKSPDTRVYTNRMEVLRGIVYYLNKMEMEVEFLDLIGSFPPSYGKSFVVNYFSAWILGRDPKNGSILRLSYSDALLNGFSRSIKSIISGERFREVFPDFEKYGNSPFEKEKDSDWKIKNSNALVSHYTRTRDGAVTGVRAKSYISYDDMTKGAEEAFNDTLHEGYWSKYMTEWRNRKDNDKVKEITIGTMWNPQDLLGRKGESLAKKYKQRKGKFPHTVEFVDEKGNVKGVVIRVPLLDENDKSTCEDIYTTETALEIRDNTDEFLFSCVYQQDPISQKGRTFSYDNIMTYKFNGSNINFRGKDVKLGSKAYASLDPVRKGDDFVSMPIFKQDDDDIDTYYLIDVVFKGKSMDEVYDDIVTKIIQHNIVKLAIENNTDTSLANYIRKLLKDRGHYDCEIVEKFQTQNKAVRIRDNNYAIRQQIVFPDNHLYPTNSEMGKFMTNITRYSVTSPNKNDDAPDSVALFITDVVSDFNKSATVEVLDASLFR